jgi:hemoglobin
MAAYVPINNFANFLAMSWLVFRVGTLLVVTDIVAIPFFYILFNPSPSCGTSMNDPISNLDFSDSEITLLVSNFYSLVKVDELLSPMYPHDDWAGAEARLRDFLIYRFGGSDRYIQRRGHPRLGMRHAPFVIGINERDRWLSLMEKALEKLELPASRKNVLMGFFMQVAEFLRNE